MEELSGTPSVPGVEGAAKSDVWALALRVRFDPPETEEDALREKDNIIERLIRVGYDVEPMGLSRLRG